MKGICRRAAIPFVSVAVGALTLGFCWESWNLLASSRYNESLRRFEAAGLPASLSETAPTAVAPGENAAPLYLEAIRLTRDTPRVRVESFRTIPDAVRDAVDASKAALEVMHRATTRPRCVFDRNYEDPATIGTVPTSRLVTLCRLLAARAVLRSEDGRLDGAIDDMRALFHTARCLREEPLLLSQIVRLAIDRIGLDALEVILPSFDSAAGTLERIALDVPRGAVAQGIRGEAAMAAGLVSHVEDPETFDLSRPDALSWVFRLRAVTAPYLKSETATYLRYVRRFFEALEASYPDAIARTQRLESEILSERGLLLNTFFVRMADSVNREAMVVSRAELARLAARCLDHRRRHGAYPATLADLATGADATDPLTDRPFALSREDGALTLSSPGDAEVAWRLPPE